EDEARQDSAGTWTLSGLMRPDEIADQVGVQLPEDEDYETLGGLIAARLGRMPEQNDQVELIAEDDERNRQRVCLTVLAMDGRRVDRVKLESEPLAEDEAAAEDEAP